MFSWKISWRNLTRRKTRTLLTFLAIAIGVSTMTAVLTAIQTAVWKVEQAVSDHNRQSGFVIRGTGYTIKQSIHDEIADMPGVEDALAALTVSAKLDKTSLPGGHEGRSAPGDIHLTILAVDHYDSPKLDWRLLEGSLSSEGLVIEEDTAKLWRLDIGTPVSLLVDGQPASVPIAAIVRNTSMLGGPTTWQDVRYGHFSVAASLPWAQRLARMEGEVRFIDVIPREGEKQDVEWQLKTMLQRYDHTYIDYVPQHESEYYMGMHDLKQGFYALAAIGMFMSLIILSTSLYVGVTERKKEFAVMKSFGMTSAQIAVQVLRETLLLASAATGAGLVAGRFFAMGLTDGVLRLLNFDVQTELAIGEPMIWSAGAGIVVSLLAAAIPLYEASRTGVAEAFRSADEERPAATGNVLRLSGLALFLGGLIGMPHWIGVLTMFAGLILIYPSIMRACLYALSPLLKLVLGFEGALAVRHVSRRMTRTALASGIVCIGLSSLVYSSFVSASMQQTIDASARQIIGGDMTVFVSTPLASSDVDNIKSIPGVRDVIPYREANIFWHAEDQRRNLTVREVHSRPDVMPMFVTREPPVQEVMRQLAQPGAIALSQVAFHSWGGRIGDAIELEIWEGVKSFRVVSVVASYVYDGHLGFVSAAHFGDAFGIHHTHQASILTHRPSDTASVQPAVADWFAERLLAIETAGQFASHMKQGTKEPFVIVNAVLVFIILVSGIGILNTLMIHVNERIREIGIMRAIASSKGQIRRVVVGEGLFIGLSGSLTGVLLGMGMTYVTAMLQGELGGIPIALTMAWGPIATAVLFGLLVGCLSSVIPASRAASVRLTEALKYE